MGREFVGVQSCMHNVSALNHPRISKMKPKGFDVGKGKECRVGVLVYHSCPMRSEGWPKFWGSAGGI